MAEGMHICLTAVMGEMLPRACYFMTGVFLLVSMCASRFMYRMLRTLIQQYRHTGDPGEGKTTLVLKLAAMLSKGLPLPCDDDRPYEPIHIIYQTAEDGIDDTIKPRLEQNGADCYMIRVIDETEKELSMTDESRRHIHF